MSDKETQRFLELTFDGERFAQHSVPVEVLPELAALQQVILDVARVLFLRQHPYRTRVPRGFVDAGKLHLVAARDNCFTAELEQRSSSGVPPNAEGLLIFANARDLCLMALRTIGEGGGMPEELPFDALYKLAGLGRRLRPNETLTVRGRGAPTLARIDKRTRGRLAELISLPLELFETLEGEIAEFSDSGRSFALRTRAGDRIELRFDPTQRETLLEALTQRPIARVRVSGELILSASPNMSQLEDLEIYDDERAGDVLKVWERLDRLTELDNGWLDGDGVRPSPDAIAFARQVLARLLVDEPGLERPRVFPTPDGGVQAEWILGRWAADVRFDSSGRIIDAEATHTDTGASRAHRFTSAQVSFESAELLVGWLGTLT